VRISKIKYFSNYYSQTSIIAFFVVLLLCFIVFGGNALPWMWMLFAIIEVLCFFFFTYLFTKKWGILPAQSFRRKLFSLAFFLRLLWVVFAYFFFIYQTGQPFAFNAADSLVYHDAGNSILYHGFLNLDSALWGMGTSDRGFPFFLGLIYYVFGDYVIIPRIFNALIGAWSAILIYQIARRNFGEQAGRIAGILAMLLPNFIYYCGLHLKEPLMVFLLLAFMERADYLLRGNKITFFNLLLTGLLGASLFFFRTVLGLSAIFALFSALLLSKRMAVNWMNRIMISFWFLLVIWFFLSARIQGEINFLLQGQDQQEVNMQFRAAREHGNTLSSYGSTMVFVPFMFVAPFPTFVNIEIQKQQMLLSGAYFVRNIYAFFVILALVFLYRRKMLRQHILILAFTFSYLFILAKSSFAISERFHMPVVPFLLILAAFGITQINPRNKKYFLPYIALIIILIIGWNWFKLAGRGAV